MPRDGQSKNNRLTLQRCIQSLRLPCDAAICDTHFRASSSHRSLELTHQFECLIALCEFLHREITQTLQTECFNAKTGQHTTVNHRSAQIVEVHLFHCAGKISGHAAGERVPCPGRIVNVFQWVRPTTKKLVSLPKE